MFEVVHITIIKISHQLSTHVHGSYDTSKEAYDAMDKLAKKDNEARKGSLLWEWSESERVWHLNQGGELSCMLCVTEEGYI
jgi:hypothetical protein